MTFASELVGSMDYVRSVVRATVYDHELHDDIVGEVLLRAWEKRDLFNGQSKLTTWLYPVAKRVAMNYCAKVADLRACGEAVEQSSPEFDPYLEADLSERLSMALRASEGRSKGFEALTLHYLHGKPIVAVAAIQGVTEGGAKSSIKATRDLFMGVLND